MGTVGFLRNGVLGEFVIEFVLSSSEEVLTHVAQWVVPCPANQKVTHLVPIWHKPGL